MLLQGPPGIGKTAYASALATALAMSAEVRSFAEMSAAWILTGASGTWSEAAPGLIASVLAEGPDRTAPLIFIDEIDKVNAGNHRPDRALLSLLQPETAARFRDEHLDVELDASRISWIFASNHLSRVRPEILSRMNVFHVKAPSAEQMPVVVRSVDRSLRQSRPALAKVFEPLGDEIIELLVEQTPRTLARLLARCYARAIAGKAQGRLTITPALVRAVTAQPVHDRSAVSADSDPPVLVAHQFWSSSAN
nr:AAA family ATPase [Solimonas marina]